MIAKHSTSIRKLKWLQIAAAIVLLPLASCLNFATHQGNVLKPAKLADVHVNDSRFHVESLLGSPVLNDSLHPNHAIYVEDYSNDDTDKQYQRRIEITYSEAGRVKTLKKFGFANKKESENK